MLKEREDIFAIHVRAFACNDPLRFTQMMRFDSLTAMARVAP